MAASMVGLAIPSLLGRFHLDARIPASPLTLAVTGLAAITICLTLAGGMLH